MNLFFVQMVFIFANAQSLTLGQDPIVPVEQLNTVIFKDSIILNPKLPNPKRRTLYGMAYNDIKKAQKYREQVTSVVKNLPSSILNRIDVVLEFKEVKAKQLPNETYFKLVVATADSIRVLDNIRQALDDSGACPCHFY